MNKKNLKIPENVHVHENFRTWKSGKQWLYASSVLALIVAGGAIAAPSVKADQVLPGQQSMQTAMRGQPQQRPIFPMVLSTFQSGYPALISL